MRNSDPQRKKEYIYIMPKISCRGPVYEKMTNNNTISLTKQLFLQLWPEQSQKKKRAIPASLEDSCITGAGEGAASS